MFRVALFFFLMLSASTAHAATTTVATSSPEAFRGTVERVTRCYPSGSAITLTNGTVVLTFGAPLFPLGATIEPGQTLYALTRATSTCDIEPSVTVNLVSGKVALAMAVSATSTGGTGGGGNGGGGNGGSGSNGGSNPIQNQFSQILNSATSKLQSFISNALNPAVPSGIPFGGPIVTLFPCSNGAIYTVLGPPTPGPYIWMPGTISYAYGPPSFVGQYLLGTSLPPPAGVCTIGKIVLTGSLIVMHGSSGPVAPTPAPSSGTAPSKAGPSCASPAGAPNTPAGKKMAEDAVRRDLAACNIKVTSSRTNGAPCAFGQNGVVAGCTDVGGLQCETIGNICDIAKQCKDGLTVAGGTEKGHKSHDDGDAVDFTADSSTNACINAFTPGADRCGTSMVRDKSGTVIKKIPYCFKTRRDSRGGLWVLETPVEGYNTGTHWHYCKPGGSC